MPALRLTPKDAVILGLIAKGADQETPSPGQSSSSQMLEILSSNARPLGDALVNRRNHGTPPEGNDQLVKAVEFLERWGGNGSVKK